MKTPWFPGRALVAALGLLAASCGFQFDVSPDAVIRCGGSADCPTGMICRQAIELCVPVSQADDDAPEIAAVRVVEGALSRAGGTVRVEVDFAPVPKNPPTFRVRAVPDRILTVIPGTAGYTIEFVVDDEPEGDNAIVADLIGDSGAVAPAVFVAAYRVDRIPPALIDDTVTVTPTIARANTPVLVRCALTEAIAPGAQVCADDVPATCIGAADSGAGLIVASLSLPGSGTFTLRLQGATDVAGNGPVSFDLGSVTVDGESPTLTVSALPPLLSPQPGHDTLSFDVASNEAVATTAFFGNDAVPCTDVSDSSVSCALVLVAPQVSGARRLAVVATDQAGNATVFEALLEVDANGPGVVPGSASATYRPDPTSVITIPTAARDGGVVTVGFALTESVSSASLTVGGVDVPLLVTGSFAVSTFTVSGAFPEGTLTLEVDAEDAVGNGGVVTVPVTVDVDRTAPALPVLDGTGAALLRAPSGALRTGGAPSVAVRLPSELFEPGATVVVFDRADLPRSVLALRPASALNETPLELPRDDRLAVFVAQADGAGNVSPVAHIEDTELTLLLSEPLAPGIRWRSLTAFDGTIPSGMRSGSAAIAPGLLGDGTEAVAETHPTLFTMPHVPETSDPSRTYLVYDDFRGVTLILGERINPFNGQPISIASAWDGVRWIDIPNEGTQPLRLERPSTVVFDPTTGTPLLVNALLCTSNCTIARWDGRWESTDVAALDTGDITFDASRSMAVGMQPTQGGGTELFGFDGVALVPLGFVPVDDYLGQIAADGAGSLFISNGTKVVKVLPDGTAEDIPLGGTGEPPATGDSLFGLPHDLLFDGDTGDLLFVGDGLWAWDGSAWHQVGNAGLQAPAALDRRRHVVVTATQEASLDTGETRVLPGILDSGVDASSGTLGAVSKRDGGVRLLRVDVRAGFVTTLFWEFGPGRMSGTQVEDPAPSRGPLVLFDDPFGAGVRAIESDGTMWSLGPPCSPSGPSPECSEVWSVTGAASQGPPVGAWHETERVFYSLASGTLSTLDVDTGVTTAVATDPALADRKGATLFYSRSLEAILIVGGADGTDPCAPDAPAATNLFRWDGAGLSAVDAGLAPRRNAAVIEDPATGDAFIFGGVQTACPGGAIQTTPAPLASFDGVLAHAVNAPLADDGRTPTNLTRPLFAHGPSESLGVSLGVSQARTTDRLMRANLDEAPAILLEVDMQNAGLPSGASLQGVDVRSEVSGGAPGADGASLEVFSDGRAFTPVATHNATGFNALDWTKDAPELDSFVSGKRLRALFRPAGKGPEAAIRVDALEVTIRYR